jgi:hypothetical protein
MSSPRKLKGRVIKTAENGYDGVAGGLKKVRLLADLWPLLTNPNPVYQDSWTDEEDRLLELDVEKYGPAWAVIAPKIKARSADRKFSEI